MVNVFDPAQALSPQGVVAKHLPNFESRDQQVKMAQAVELALDKGLKLAVEAGTGVGKSFAYLLPAINAAIATKSKVLISTYTITLQEQLINKDIPLLAEALSCHFTASLAKGRSNYICLRRLDFAIRKQQGLFEASTDELFHIQQWSGQTKDGSLSDLDFVPSAGVWDAVKSEHGNCKGRKCPNQNKCFYWKARRRLESSEIIIANHALMFSDLALKEEGASILPEYRYVIIDEGHNLEHVAEDHFGINITSGQIKFLLDGLYNPRTHKGFLVYRKANELIDLVADIHIASRDFFKKINDWYEGATAQTAGRCYRNFIEDSITEPLTVLKGKLSQLSKSCSDEDEKFEIIRFMDRCAAFITGIRDFINQPREDFVYWVEAESSRRKIITLRAASVNIGPEIKRSLFDAYESVVLTSATLSTDNSEKGGFDFFAGRVGLTDYSVVKLGSPFDYQKQVTVYIEKQLPDPKDPQFITLAAESVKKYVKKTGGRAFVLFTSYSMLEKVADDLREWLAGEQIELLQQGSGFDRSALLRKFKQGGAVLFGTDSFWQGVDVPGDALSNVIIVKLPFAVPNQPLLAGKLDQLRKEGRNPFSDYQLPCAIIKFKQGFGRLIRTKTDSGIVVILDSRIVNSRYGSKFLAAIPKCKVEIV
ncbi:MAG: helicase C-terminal domain-containing protein [Phycisphaerae bacterium]|nr:helicase C-terminal domain-containing protein [Phycisphaerae bacterium]